MAVAKLNLNDLIQGKLPAVCIVCGKPADHRAMRTLRAWRTTRTRVRLRDKVPLPVCSAHRSHWAKMNLLGSLAGVSAILVWFAVAATCFHFATGSTNRRFAIGVVGGLIGGMGLAALWLAISIGYLASKRVMARAFTSAQATLTGVSPTFVAACQQAGCAAAGA